MSVPETTQQEKLYPPSPTVVYLGLALILPIFALAPLFYPGYIQTHSGFILPWNVADLRANLGDLSWLPHLALNFDFLRSDGLLPYYLAALLPFAPIVAIKTVFGLSWLLGSIGMFLWLRRWLQPPGALVAALVYLYLPYQIATVYVRGAWGETLFWGLLPWGLLAATYLVASPRPLSTLVAAFFWLLLGLSQLGLTFLALIFTLLLLLTLHLRQSLWPILAAVTGAAAAFICYLLLVAPAAGSPVDFSEHFLFPFQLFSAFWDFGPSRPGWHDGLSLQLGLAAVGLTMMSVTLWQRSRPAALTVSRTDRRLIFFLGAVLVSALLQLNLFAFVWRLPVLPDYKLSGLLTYPWQLSGLTGLCLAVLAGTVLWLDTRLTTLPLFGAIVVLIILSSYSYLAPRFIQPDAYLDDGPQAQLGAAQLTLLEHNFTVSTSGNTAGLQRGQTEIPLAVHGPLQADELLLLNVTWQPLRTFTQDWKIFVHLVDANNQVLAQFDGHPQAGDYPTSHWVPGEIIADTYPLQFPADAPPGPYRVFLGLYDEATQTRLPVSSDSEGRIILDVQ